MAWAEWTTGKSTAFDAEVAEVDAASTVVRQVGADVREHAGRIIAFKGRRSKKWAIEPLGPRLVPAKDGSSPQMM